MFVMLVAMLFVVIMAAFVTIPMAIPVIVLEGDRLDPRGGDHVHAAEIRRFDQPVQPPLEVEAVDHEDIRLAHRAGGGRGRSVHMRISVRPDQRGDRHVFAADTRHHVAENREGGDHPNRRVGLGRCRG